MFGYLILMKRTLALAVAAFMLSTLGGISAPPAMAQVTDLSSSEARKAAAIALSLQIGKVMIASGSATEESVAEAIFQLEQDLASHDPTIEELEKMRSIGRGVVGQAIFDAEKEGKTDVATALRAVEDNIWDAEIGPRGLPDAFDRAVAVITGETDGVEVNNQTSAVSDASVASATTGSTQPETETNVGTEDAGVTVAAAGDAGSEGAMQAAGIDPETPTIVTSVETTADDSAPVQAAGAVTIVFDGSNSMWGQVDGRAKIEIAREALAELVSEWNPNTELGLMAFGHRREGDCTDIETLRPPGPADPLKFVLAVGGISPKGKSPVSAAVRQAADELGYTDRLASVILFSDGIETCDGDPCALAAELEAKSIGFTAHVVGFSVEGDDEQLSCLAATTGGLYLAADNTQQLERALDTVRTFATEPEAANLVTFEALDADTGEVIRSGIRWRVVSLSTEEGVPINAATSRPTLPLDPGQYFVEATLGDIIARAEVEVAENTGPQRVSLRIDRDTAPDAVGRTLVPTVEAEPNDSFGTATEVGNAGPASGDGSSFGNAVAIASSGTVAATLPPNGTLWRVFDTDDQGALTLNLQSVPRDTVMSARIWSAEKSALTGWMKFTSGTEVFNIVDPGIYFLEIRGQGAGGTASLDLSFSPTGDRFEPNGSFGTRADLPLNDTVEFALLPGADQDWFGVDVDDQGALTLALEGAPPQNIQPVVRLWNADRSAPTGWIELNQATELHLAAPGRYALEIRESGGDASAAERLRMVPQFSPTGDAHEPNPIFGQAAAIPSSGLLSASIFPAGDVDWYRIDVPDQGTLTLSDAKTAGDVGLRVRLWNADKSALTGWLDFRDGAVAFDLANPGGYALEIRDLTDRNAAVAPYTLAMDFAATGEATEQNGRFGLAAELTPGDPLEGAVLPKADADWRRLHVSNRGLLSLRPETVPEGIQLEIRLWNNEASAMTGFSGLPPGKDLALELPRGGDYLLELREIGSDGRGPERYMIATSFVSARAEVEPEDGGSLVGTIFPAGDTDWFAVELDEGGKIELTPADLPQGMALEMRLWNRERSALTGFLPFLVNGQKTPAAFETKAPGTFLIELRATGAIAASTDRYRLTLSGAVAAIGAGTVSDKAEAPQALPPENGSLSASTESWTVDHGGFEAKAGEIVASPAGDGLTSYFIAPVKMHGDWSSYDQLVFEKKSWGGSYYGPDQYGAAGDVVIASGDITARHDIAPHHDEEWLTYQIPLSPEAWQMSDTDISFEEFLRGIADLRIRAEYGAGTDYSALRNIALQ